MQHRIRFEGLKLSELIVEKGAWIYVSGRAKNMPKSVEKAFGEIIEENYKEKAIEGKGYILEMRKNGRYQQEVW